MEEQVILCECKRVDVECQGSDLVTPNKQTQSAAQMWECDNKHQLRGVESLQVDSGEETRLQIAI